MYHQTSIRGQGGTNQWCKDPTVELVFMIRDAGWPVTYLWLLSGYIASFIAVWTPETNLYYTVQVYYLLQLRHCVVSVWCLPLAAARTCAVHRPHKLSPELSLTSWWCDRLVVSYHAHNWTNRCYINTCGVPCALWYYWMSGDLHSKWPCLYTCSTIRTKRANPLWSIHLIPAIIFSEPCWQCGGSERFTWKFLYRL